MLIKIITYLERVGNYLRICYKRRTVDAGLFILNKMEIYHYDFNTCFNFVEKMKN